VIDLILPSGEKNFLDVEVGNANLKLCTIKNKYCFRARAVMMAQKFPGIFFTDYYSTVLIRNHGVTSERQFKYIAELMTKKKLESIPAKRLHIRLDANVTERDRMNFKSELNTLLRYPQDILIDVK